MGRGSPSMSTMTSTSDSFSSSIPEADRKFLMILYFAFLLFINSCFFIGQPRKLILCESI